MKKNLLILGLGLLVGSVVFVACKPDENVTPAASPSLYTRLGGTTEVNDPDNAGQKIQAGRLAIRGVIVEAVGRVAADTTFKPHFATLLAELGANPSNTTGYTKLVESFTTFVQNAAGNTDIKYTGRNMRAAHVASAETRMGKVSTGAEFDIFINHCADALVAKGVKADSKEFAELAAALIAQKADVTQQ